MKIKIKLKLDKDKDLLRYWALNGMSEKGLKSLYLRQRISEDELILHSLLKNFIIK